MPVYARGRIDRAAPAASVTLAPDPADLFFTPATRAYAGAIVSMRFASIVHIRGIFSSTTPA